MFNLRILALYYTIRNPEMAAFVIVDTKINNAEIYEQYKKLAKAYR